MLQMTGFQLGPFDRSKLCGMALVLVSAAILCSTLSAYIPIHVWFWDASEYIYNATTYSYFHDDARRNYWVLGEGRWINAFLMPFLVRIDGKLTLFTGFLCFFLFSFITARRYTESNVSAFIFAALCVQAPPWVEQASWPWVSFLPTLGLLAAALLVNRLPIYLFYILFGCLISGSIQSFYYLLPLCHLPLLSGPGFRTHLRTLSVRIVPAWIGGFIVGNLLTLVVVWFYSGSVMGTPRFGLEIPEWRIPEDTSIGANIFRSVLYFGYHVYVFMLLADPWAVAIVIGALAIGAPSVLRSVPVRLLLAGIALWHYVAIIPLGIIMAVRTAIPAAVAFAAFVFLWPPAPRLKYIAQVLMLCMSAAWSIQSTQALHWQATVANVYHVELLRVVPMAPHLYTGVVLANDPALVVETTRAIQKHFGIIPRDYLGYRALPVLLIDDLADWRPVAFEVGFKDVKLCGDKNEPLWEADTATCQEVARMHSPDTVPETRAGDTTRLYTVLGELDGYLVVSLDPRWSSRILNPARGTEE